MSVATGSVQATMQLSAVIAEQIKHKHSQKESNFPLPSLTSALPPCSRPLEFIQPLATRAEAWQAIPGVSEWVMGDNKTRLFTPIRSKTPAIQRRGLHLGAGRECSLSALRGDDAAGKRSHRNGFFSFERVRLLQPLLPHPQKGWRPPAHPRSQTPESRPHETAVQDDHAEADPLADSHRRLVLLSGPERCILSHPDNPPLQTILEIRLRGSGLPVHGPTLWAVSGPPYIYEVHGHGSFPSETDGNLHSQLPRRLAHSGPVRGGTTFTQNPHPQPLRAPGAQGQFRQKRTVSQPTNIVPGYSSGLSSHDNARTRSGHSETRGHLQERHRSPTQNVSENAGPYGRSIASVTAGPAPHAPPSTLVETTGSTQRMASRTLAYQGESGLCNSPDPLEEPTVDGEGRGHGVEPHQESCHDNTGWGALCEGKPTFGHWSKTESGFHINCLEMLAVCRACQFFLPDLIGRHVLIRSDNMSVGGHQGGVSSKRLFILAERLLEWAQRNLRSLRAAHLPGRLNQGADMLSRSNVPSEEWMLHPQVVQKIWKTFGKAEVDLLASKDNSHCPTYYSKDRDTLANLLLYAFPPIALLPQVVRRIREQGHKVLLVAPLWRNQRRFAFAQRPPTCVVVKTFLVKTPVKTPFSIHRVFFQGVRAVINQL